MTNKNTTEKVENKAENKTATNKNTTEKVGDKKIKIELLCDVFYEDKKLKAGEKIELNLKELEKFASSFYKKI